MTKKEVYRKLAAIYKWTFKQIADMTPYQQAAALGNILPGDSSRVSHFDSLDDALMAIAFKGLHRG